MQIWPGLLPLITFQWLSITRANEHDKGEQRSFITWPLYHFPGTAVAPLVSLCHWSSLRIKYACPWSMCYHSEIISISSPERILLCVFISLLLSVFHKPTSLHGNSLFTCLSNPCIRFRVSCLRPSFSVLYIPHYLAHNK